MGNPTTLLDYEIIASPYPLVAARSTASPPASLDLVVSNSGSEVVYCKWIAVTVPVGDLAQSLTTDFSAIRASANPSGDWSFDKVTDNTLYGVPQDEKAVFAGKPTTDPARVAENGVILGLYNIPVNKQPGITSLHIRENVSRDGTTWTRNDRYLRLVKGTVARTNEPRSFYASPSDVDRATEVTLHWDGSPDLGYWIERPDGKDPAPVPDPTSYKVGRIDRTTTFHLLVRDTRDEQHQVRYRLSTTVTVRNPKYDAAQVRNLLVGEE
ncbi:hypothetical protein [Streptomyces hainanensis]|uniref:Uncharacterized protein n=1 Tax=Streptomyces hainanensis TaxID=402648 RepID=A0A4R4TT32_9ACTN|nr:hypothetical protein [Streptomyces hainanensis]TDC78373.1 hypothetical protein E1283_05235 [Streptomyces hainanensis]